MSGARRSGGSKKSGDTVPAPASVLVQPPAAGRKRPQERAPAGRSRPSSSVHSVFPSARQASCEGLKRQFYPDYLADLVDYDYDDDLPPEARQFLAAFTEEHYKGFRLKAETQVTPIEHIRAADASRKRVVRGEDVMAFAKHINREVQVMTDRGGVPGVFEEGHGGNPRQETLSCGRARHRISSAAALVAGVSGLQAHEFVAANHVEEAAAEALDEFRAQLEVDRARALRAIEPGLHVPTLAELDAATSASKNVPSRGKTQRRRRRRAHTQ